MQFTGISASPGIALGRALLFLEEKLTIPRYDVPAAQREAEYARFLSALSRASEEVKGLATGRDASLFAAQLLFFEDPELKRPREGRPGGDGQERGVDPVHDDRRDGGAPGRLAGSLPAREDRRFPRRRQPHHERAAVAHARPPVRDHRAGHPRHAQPHAVRHPRPEPGVRAGHRGGRGGPHVPHGHPCPVERDPGRAGALGHQPAREGRRQPSSWTAPRAWSSWIRTPRRASATRGASGSGKGWGSSCGSCATCPPRPRTGSFSPSRRTSSCPRRSAPCSPTAPTASACTAPSSSSSSRGASPPRRSSTAPTRPCSRPWANAG